VSKSKKKAWDPDKKKKQNLKGRRKREGQKTLLRYTLGKKRRDGPG